MGESRTLPATSAWPGLAVELLAERAVVGGVGDAPGAASRHVTHTREPGLAEREPWRSTPAKPDRVTEIEVRRRR